MAGQRTVGMEGLLRDTPVMPAESRSSQAPLARGNTSDVWTWTAQTVIKVLRPGIPDHWANLEAETLARVHAAGVPVPATEGVIEFDGRPGIVLERIEGVAMWERMKAQPSSVPGLIYQLVDLQTQVQANVNGQNVIVSGGI